MCFLPEDAQGSVHEVLEGPRRPGIDCRGCRQVRWSVMRCLNQIGKVRMSELAVEAADALPEGDELLEASGGEAVESRGVLTA